MSGIAQLLLAQGQRLSGSDLKSTQLTRKLSALGAGVSIGHAGSNLQDADLVIYSSAIKPNNPELVAARERNLTVLNRAQALAALANQKKEIAVTGAHGKTTTTSLIAHLLVKCGCEPTVCVGGELLGLNGNAFLGAGNLFVLEADESDGSFLNFTPFYSVITNIDREHLDYYRDLDQIIESFGQFMQNTKREGCVFFCQDDPKLVKLASSLKVRTFGYSLLNSAEIFARDIRMQSDCSRFRCIYRDQDLGEALLKVPGRHNISNTLVALAVGLELGLEFGSLRQALSLYAGVRRRLELKLKKNNILVFEDYAHHPTEIKATISSLRNFQHKRILAVFQPHRYTRTKFLMEEFGNCFQGVDRLIVTDIYAASEAPIKGVDAQAICQKAKAAKVKEVLFLPKSDIIGHLLAEIQGGDLVAILGAGDIGSVADDLAKRL